MIFITGATGLVGSHLLLNLLNENPESKITALYRSAHKKEKICTWLLYKNSQLNIKNIIWEEADITDIPRLETIIKQANHVYHCAAIVDFDPKNRDLLNKINIEGTANVVNLSLRYNIKKLCYVSSVASLGDANQDGWIDENCEWNPEKFNGYYAISKNGGEIEVWRGINEGLNAVIVNPGVIIGDGLFDGGSTEIFNQINKGFPFYTKGTTGFISVTDVVQCMIKLMQTNINAQRFILVETNPTFQEVLSKVALSINKKQPHIYASKFITSIAWRMDALLSMLFFKKRQITKDTASASHTITLYNNAKIKQAINYQFTPILNYIQTVGIEYLKK